LASKTKNGLLQPLCSLLKMEGNDNGNALSRLGKEGGNQADFLSFPLFGFNFLSRVLLRLCLLLLPACWCLFGR
jgi:hypothetical protein